MPRKNSQAATRGEERGRLRSTRNGELKGFYEGLLWVPPECNYREGQSVYWVVMTPLYNQTKVNLTNPPNKK